MNEPDKRTFDDVYSEIVKDEADREQQEIQENAERLAALIAEMDEMPPNQFHPDGSAYEGNWLERLRAWAKDFEGAQRIVHQDQLWNGCWISTVWIGVRLGFRPGADGKPYIYETAVFDNLTDAHTEIVDRYTNVDDAIAGHAAVVREYSTLWATVVRWFRLGQSVSAWELEDASWGEQLLAEED